MLYGAWEDAAIADKMNSACMYRSCLDSKLVAANTGFLYEHIGLTGFTSTSASLPVAGRISLPSRLVLFPYIFRRSASGSLLSDSGSISALATDHKYRTAGAGIPCKLRIDVAVCPGRIQHTGSISDTLCIVCIRCTSELDSSPSD